MAFSVAVSGLSAATADLDATGNNIANVGTTGFKGSRVQFADVYGASNLGPSSNAIGQGVAIADVAQQFTQGNITFTDNNLDLAINGTGFFVVEDSAGRYYSRAGAFGLDKDGYVVNATGQQLLGYRVSDGRVTGSTGALQISTTNLPPQATSRIGLTVNLDAADEVPPDDTFDPENPDSYNDSTALAFFDSLGAEHVASVYFVKTDVSEWDAHLLLDDDEVATQALQFGDDGLLTSPEGAVALEFTTDWDPGAGAASFEGLDLDFTGTTQFGTDFGVNALSQDGYTTGRLSAIEINPDGIVLGRFSNGETAPQGQVALANFGSPQGLQPIGNTLWAETTDSGPPLIGAPGTASLGLVQSGALEESNVDLAQELVDMIIAQRNYQANARVIQAEDELTQTIINIR
jgi:flagellar hook protein FlgE